MRKWTCQAKVMEILILKVDMVEKESRNQSQNYLLQPGYQFNETAFFIEYLCSVDTSPSVKVLRCSEGIFILYNWAISNKTRMFKRIL